MKGQIWRPDGEWSNGNNVPSLGMPTLYEEVFRENAHPESLSWIGRSEEMMNMGVAEVISSLGTPTLYQEIFRVYA